MRCSLAFNEMVTRRRLENCHYQSLNYLFLQYVCEKISQRLTARFWCFNISFTSGLILLPRVCLFTHTHTHRHTHPRKKRMRQRCTCSAMGTETLLLKVTTVAYFPNILYYNLDTINLLLYMHINSHCMSWGRGYTSNALKNNVYINV